MKKLRSVGYMIGMPAMIAASIYYDSKFCANVFTAVGWLSIITMLSLSAKANAHRKAAMIAAYNDPKGPHLPKWIDVVWYSAMICALAGFGWWTNFVMWCLIAGYDFNMRDEASKPATATVSANVVIAE
jgi:hypothetical protein